jgi:DDE superfamily endonuclease
VASVKEIAARQGRIIVFIDESGLSERPCSARTWAPKGQTPVLQYSFSWKQLSVIAGVSFWRFYFHFFPGSIKSPQIIEFLKAL